MFPFGKTASKGGFCLLAKGESTEVKPGGVNNNSKHHYSSILAILILEAITRLKDFKIFLKNCAHVDLYMCGCSKCTPVASRVGGQKTARDTL